MVRSHPAHGWRSPHLGNGIVPDPNPKGEVRRTHDRVVGMPRCPEPADLKRWHSSRAYPSDTVLLMGHGGCPSAWVARVRTRWDLLRRQQSQPSIISFLSQAERLANSTTYWLVNLLLTQIEAQIVETFSWQHHACFRTNFKLRRVRIVEPVKIRPKQNSVGHDLPTSSMRRHYIGCFQCCVTIFSRYRAVTIQFK